MDNIFSGIIVFIFGALVGSFLNVCIYRIPRGLSIVYPSSMCPSCNTAIRPWDNIPLVSCILLGGKCRHCRTRISWRYPLVELLNALLYTGVLWRFGPGWHTPVFFIFCSALVVITFIDIDFQIIPDQITLTGIPVGLIAGSLILPDPFLRDMSLGFNASAIGMLAGGGLFYAVAVISRGGMGGGDIKMMAMVGACMGWKAILLTTFLGSLSGSVVGIFLMLFKGRGRKAKVPFGPFLAFGAMITLFYGQEILVMYLGRQIV
jgi:leader peptidase (prepilin peptidase)/N-methyltransferase